MWRVALAFGLALTAVHAHAEVLSPDRLGVVYDADSPASVRIAEYYAALRHVPAANLVGLPVPDKAVIDRAELARLRAAGIDVPAV